MFKRLNQVAKIFVHKKQDLIQLDVSSIPLHVAIIMDGNDELKKLEKNGEITEDELRSLTEEIQKVTDQHVAKIDTLTKEKEKEIMEV